MMRKHQQSGFEIDTVIFDLGGVLIDWNPRYLYREIFCSEEAVSYFLEHVCDNDWNEAQDGGRSLAEGTKLLAQAYPQYQSEIEAYYGRWEQMLRGAYMDTVAILHQLSNQADIKLYALTNWSAETWPIALKRFDFLSIFEGIVVSGVEHLRKPHPMIYDLICTRYDIDKYRATFIDDNLRNIVAAKAYGLDGIHYKNAEQLRSALWEYN